MWQITTIFHNISTYARLQADSPAYPVLSEKSVSRYPQCLLGFEQAYGTCDQYHRSPNKLGKLTGRCWTNLFRRYSWLILVVLVQGIQSLSTWTRNVAQHFAEPQIYLSLYMPRLTWEQVRKVCRTPPCEFHVGENDRILFCRWGNSLIF
jgi:hypothetical protein